MAPKTITALDDADDATIFHRLAETLTTRLLELYEIPDKREARLTLLREIEHHAHLSRQGYYTPKIPTA